MINYLGLYIQFLIVIEKSKIHIVNVRGEKK